MFASLFILAVACAPSEGEVASRLTRVSASDGQDGYDAVTVDGLATVTGTGADWALALTTEASTVVDVTLHAPGASDLSGLDGHTLSVTLGERWSSDERDVRIDDEEGAVWLAQVHSLGVANTEFGDDFVAYGDDLGTGTLTDDYGDYSVTWHDLVFQTDDGAVHAEVGAPFVATVGGTQWRIVVHAAFEVTDQPDTMPGCGGGIGSSLSFEMLRVVDAADERPIDPVSDVSRVSHTDCG